MALRKRAIIDVVSKDAEISFVYATSTGQTCAIGGLAKAAGVPLDVLLAAKGAGIRLDSKKPPRSGIGRAVNTIRRAIAKRYGLRVFEMAEIQRLNDVGSSYPAFTRRKDIINYVKGLTR